MNPPFNFWPNSKVNLKNYLGSVRLHLKGIHLPLFIGLIACYWSLDDLIYYPFFLLSLVFLALKIFTPQNLARFHTYTSWPLVLWSSYLVYNHFGTLLDIEAGMNLLMLMHALKLYESKSNRDLFIDSLILCFLIAGMALYSTTLGTFFLILILSFINYLHMAKIENPQIVISGVGLLLKDSLSYIAIALAFTVTLFLLFPRFNVGLSPFADRLGRTGFSSEVEPGMVDQILLSNRKVFEAQILEEKSEAVGTESRALPWKERYWVGAILTLNDGFNWTLRRQKPKQDKKFWFLQDPKIIYDIYIKSVASHFLYSLTYPVGPPIPNPRLITKEVAPHTFTLTEKIPKRIRYRLSSYPKLERKESWDQVLQKVPRQYLSYPKKINSSSLQKLTQKLKGPNDQATIENTLKYFASENFSYTLNPGSVKSLEEFLFRSKRGFCIHFASAAALLLRLQNIPTRVVSGFHGGSFNPLSRTYTILEKDAHAWVEAYIHGQGWRSLDPVASVAPLRIEQGGVEYFDNMAARGSFWARTRRLWLKVVWSRAQVYYSTLNTYWSSFITHFHLDFQRKVAQSLSLSLNKLYLGVLLSPLLFMSFLFILFGLKEKSNSRESLRTRQYRRFLRRLEKKGFEKKKDWSPKRFAAHLEKIEGINEKERKRWIDFLLSYHQFCYALQKD